MKKCSLFFIVFLFLLSIPFVGCQTDTGGQTEDSYTATDQPAVSSPLPEEGGTEMVEKFKLSSTVFSDGGTIPVRYTCDGNDISPPLAWTGVPVGTSSLVLIVDDPDAPVGTWVHWLLYDIPVGINDLPEGLPATDKVTDIGTQGINDFQKIGYGGPCPPLGKPHRYFFKLYALDTMLSLDPGKTKKELENAIQGHILAKTELIGTYGR